MFGIKLPRLWGIHCQPQFPLRSGLCEGHGLWLRSQFCEEIKFGSDCGSIFSIVSGGSGLVLQDAMFSRQEVLEEPPCTFLNAQLMRVSLSSPAVLTALINSDKHVVSKPLFLWQCIVHVGGCGTISWLALLFDVLLAFFGRSSLWEGKQAKVSVPRMGVPPACAPHAKPSPLHERGIATLW